MQDKIGEFKSQLFDHGCDADEESKTGGHSQEPVKESEFGSCSEEDENPAAAGGDGGTVTTNTKMTLRKRDVKKLEKIIEAPQLNIRGQRKKQKWTKKEHDLFLAALETHGKDFAKITQAVGTIDIARVRSYAHNLIKMFKKDPTMKGAHLLEELEKPLQRGRKKAPTNEINAMIVDVDDESEDAQS